LKGKLIQIGWGMILSMEKPSVSTRHNSIRQFVVEEISIRQFSLY
jgi:hypothetical protein